MWVRMLTPASLGLIIENYKSLTNKMYFQRQSFQLPLHPATTVINGPTHQCQGIARTLLGRLRLFFRCVHVSFNVAVGLEGGGRVEGKILCLTQNAASGEEEESELARFQPQKASFRNAEHLGENKGFFGIV